jgi:hypothetical protein
MLFRLISTLNSAYLVEISSFAAKGMNLALDGHFCLHSMLGMYEGNTGKVLRVIASSWSFLSILGWMDEMRFTTEIVVQVIRTTDIHLCEKPGILFRRKMSH